MSGLIDKRKRSREDDLCDSTPLSKRINQLHLTNNMEEPQQQLMQQQHQMQHFNNPNSSKHTQVIYKNNNLNINVIQQQQQHHHVHQQQQSHIHLQQEQHHQHQTYTPELNETENPFYYIKNKLLYELHIERLKRCTL